MDYFENVNEGFSPKTAKKYYSNFSSLFMRLFIASYAIFGITIFSFVWILLYTFNPDFVKVSHQHEIFVRPYAHPDPFKCFMFAFVAAILSIFLLWALTRCGPN